VPLRAPSALAIAALAAATLVAPTTAPAYTHVVAPGESLSSVAAADGLSVAELAAANSLSDEAELTAGSDLTIPAQGSAATEPASAVSADESEADSTGPPAERASSTAEGGSYVVEPGDTLSAIAAREGTTVQALASLNGLDPAGLLVAGTVLDLPGGSPEGGPAAATGNAEAPATIADAPPYTTEETVSPSEVASVAVEHGIPPSLVEAVAEQESGFNNGLTSSADARGVMQILPETWSFINNNLAAGRPLEPASASSNVRGGVLLLQHLLNETEGDEAAAVAGYFQGLESVRQNGESPETEEYVDSVLELQSRFSGE
jgi:LysM repeat protein